MISCRIPCKWLTRASRSSGIGIRSYYFPVDTCAPRHFRHLKSTMISSLPLRLLLLDTPCSVCPRRMEGEGRVGTSPVYHWPLPFDVLSSRSHWDVYSGV